MKKIILVLVTLLSACYIFCFTSCKDKEGQNVYDGTVVNAVVYVNFKDAEIFLMDCKPFLFEEYGAGVVDFNCNCKNEKNR